MKLRNLPPFLAQLSRHIPHSTQVVILFALTTVLGHFVLRRSLNFVRKHFLQWFTKSSDTEWQHLISQLLIHTKSYFFWATSIYLSSQFFTLSPKLSKWLDHISLVLLLFQLVEWGFTAIEFWINNYVKAQSGNGGRVTTARALGILTKVIFVLILFLIALENFGVNINALIAGLGIGGVAVALAVQKILGDLLASLTIILDKPFVIGDFIVTKDCMGSIESIGLKTTRIRSLTGEQIIFPNADLLQSQIRNYQRMSDRRIVFNFGVTYDTSPDMVEKIPAMVKDIVLSHSPTTRFEYTFFKSYADWSLNFECVYWINSPSYQTYTDTHHKILLELKKTFALKKISFAFPTRVNYLIQTEEARDTQAHT